MSKTKNKETKKGFYFYSGSCSCDYRVVTTQGKFYFVCLYDYIMLCRRFVITAGTSMYVVICRVAKEQNTIYQKEMKRKRFAFISIQVSTQ